MGFFRPASDGATPRAVPRGTIDWQEAGPEKGSFWALKDISFSVERGEILALLGINGAGKTTLLKILAKVIKPTGGRAVVRAKVASLFEVGTGFHPELSGRANIYLNGALLGMRRKEIDAKLDEIIAFSEIGTFIDTPLRYYSSGMHLRLAFSIAAHLSPEILLLDEIFSVGDHTFRSKCVEKMKDVVRRGRVTVLLATHDLGAARRLCRRALYLKAGKTAAFGPVAEVCQQVQEDALREGPELSTASIEAAVGAD